MMLRRYKKPTTAFLQAKALNGCISVKKSRITIKIDCFINTILQYERLSPQHSKFYLFKLRCLHHHLFEMILENFNQVSTPHLHILLFYERRTFFAVCHSPSYLVKQEIPSIAFMLDRKSTRLNSSHSRASRMPSSA